MSELLECPNCGLNTAWIDENRPDILHCNTCGIEWEIEIPKPTTRREEK